MELVSERVIRHNAFAVVGNNDDNLIEIVCDDVIGII
jgi:hypothetical protein